MQGATELAPVSSSGHLLLVPWLLRWSPPEDPQAVEAIGAVLHLASLVGPAVVLRGDITVLLHGLRYAGPERDRALQLAGSVLPAVVVGAPLAGRAAALRRDPVLVARLLAGFGLLLGVADRLGRQDHDEPDRVDLAAMALAQVIALVPGVSRSGITLTVARLRGVARPAATRTAALMSLPAVVGAAVRTLPAVRPDQLVALRGPLLSGAAAAAGGGLLAARLTMRHPAGTSGFAAYRVLAGVLLLRVARRRRRTAGRLLA